MRVAITKLQMPLMPILGLLNWTPATRWLSRLDLLKEAQQMGGVLPALTCCGFFFQSHFWVLMMLQCISMAIGAQHDRRVDPYLNLIMTSPSFALKLLWCLLEHEHYHNVQTIEISMCRIIYAHNRSSLKLALIWMAIASPCWTDAHCLIGSHPFTPPIWALKNHQSSTDVDAY